MYTYILALLGIKYFTSETILTCILLCPLSRVVDDMPRIRTPLEVDNVGTLLF